MRSKKITALLIASAILLCGCSNNQEQTPASTDGAASTEAPQTTAGGNNAENTEENTESEAPSVNQVEIGDTSYADGAEDSVFSLDGGLTPRMKALIRLNEGNQVRLANMFKKAASGENITVAYLGGSITQGSSATDSTCYSRLVTDWFKETFPDITVTYVKAGIGATGSYIGVHRADKDVLSQNPDVVFVDFTVNDTTENTQRNINSYDSLMRKLWNGESKPAIVCIGMTQDDGTAFQSQHLEVAQHYDLPFISYRNAILDVINKGYIKWTDISGDNIHPNVPGHKVLTDMIVDYLTEVMENRDSISGDESDFSTPYTDNLYEEATILNPLNTEAVDPDDVFAPYTESFGNMKGYWMASVGVVDGDTVGRLTFKDVEFRNLGLLFGRTTNGGGLLHIYVDGEEVKTISTKFPNGWGDYVEASEVVSYDEKGTHTVEIVPEWEDESLFLYVDGLMIS
ncbi:MAG: SGNH/GDSL hydrolase family protein [Firmicutes bacterium]|nr:SGNH/GDSL hydrolase family protein [[Eubacterium] siraeum]MCM1488785.1 SGNH/GDSL hydrolase family protein [Bacillota bacterium]